MKKIISTLLLGSFAYIGNAETTVVRRDDNYGEEWRECLTNDIQDTLRKKNSEKINFKNYEVKGLDYLETAPFGKNYYIADLKDVNSGHFIRAYFKGIVTRSLLKVYNPVTKISAREFYCGIDAGQDKTTVVLKVIDLGDESIEYLSENGTVPYEAPRKAIPGRFQ